MLTPLSRQFIIRKEYQPLTTIHLCEASGLIVILLSQREIALLGEKAAPQATLLRKAYAFLFIITLIIVRNSY
jgi:hypothetical protein